MKLIGVFLLPVCFIILLGVISFNKASTALINNYKASTLSNLNSMASYLDLGFDMVSDKATLLNTNSILKNYYSGNYKDKQLEEMKKYKELQEFAYANILSDNIIKNIYIFGSYGNAILTKGTSSASLYSDFMNSEDGLSFLNSGESKKWIGSHPYLDSVADEVIQGVQSQCEGTESSLTEMSELSQQIERLCESTELIRKSAYNTTEITKKGMIIIDELELKTKKSSAIINSVIENIEELEHKSNAISGILKSINEIAAQTNLLSLNATIEAARSGIEGLGFQVVANEIKHLAEKSAQEAKRIGSIIAEIQDQTQITVKNAKNAQEEEAERVAALKGAVLVFSDIDNNVKMLSSNLDHIMTSINEIENAKEDTLAAFEEISAISQQTTAAMDQFRDTASRQLEAVESLNKAVEELGIDSNLLEKKISVFRTDS